MTTFSDKQPIERQINAETLDVLVNSTDEVRICVGAKAKIMGVLLVLIMFLFGGVLFYGGWINNNLEHQLIGISLILFVFLLVGLNWRLGGWSKPIFILNKLGIKTQNDYVLWSKVTSVEIKNMPKTHSYQPKKKKILRINFIMSRKPHVQVSEYHMSLKEMEAIKVFCEAQILKFKQTWDH